VNIVKKLLHNKIIRFFLVGGLNTAFGYGLFSLLIYAGMHYALDSFICIILGILFNFKTIGSLVFKNKNNMLIFKFFGVYGINYVLSVLFLAIFKHFGINEYIGGAILVVPMGLFGYVLFHYFVFNKTNTSKI
jgi:putative flippase GtrA